MRLNLDRLNLNRSNLLTAAGVLALGSALGTGGALARVADRADAATAAQAAPAAAVVAAPTLPAQTVLRTARGVLDAAGIESAVEKTRTQKALDALAGQVRKQSDPSALKMAFQAYFNYKAAHPEQVRKPYLYYVDYGLDSRTPRGYLFDMEALKVLDGPFTVAHGRGSDPASRGLPTKFSNREGSNATSLGLYLAQETYTFSGKAGGKRYSSVGLRLKGLSGRFNSAARQRRVVAHGAPYVTPSKAGRSEGCPAVEQGRARTLLPRISDGGLVFLFSPLDRDWMKQDPWAAAEGPARG